MDKKTTTGWAKIESKVIQPMINRSELIQNYNTGVLYHPAVQYHGTSMILCQHDIKV